MQIEMDRMEESTHNETSLFLNEHDQHGGGKGKGKGKKAGRVNIGGMMVRPGTKMATSAAKINMKNAKASGSKVKIARAKKAMQVAKGSGGLIQT